MKYLNHFTLEYIVAAKVLQYTIHIKYTNKKENQIFLIYREIQNGAVTKSYMTNGFPVYGEIFPHFLIY